MAEGSLEEVKYYLILSQDLGYIPSSDDLMAQAETVGRLLSGLTASTRRRKQGVRSKDSRFARF